MKILVVDVAAEHSGAQTILEQFVKEFIQDTNNEYVCLLSKLSYEDNKCVHFLNYRWVKKSYWHRLFFDYIYIRRIIKQEKPDKILSLQNNIVASCGKMQEVYFHNALYISEKKYSIRESKSLWVYQKIISVVIKKSLKKANRIFVQANWIQEAIISKWNINIEKIEVKRPECDPVFVSNEPCYFGGNVFYPANFSRYKNHISLLNACIDVWNERGKSCGLVLNLLGDVENYPPECKAKIEGKDYPIFFHGRLTKEEMKEMYKTTVLFFPSLVETVGLPLMEASAVGSRIFASDLKYAHESLKGYERCTFFAPENVDEIRHYLVGLISGKVE